MPGPGVHRVSVIIPHYNRVSRLLDSLKSLTSQSMREFEVIIVDDASPTDPTAEILRNSYDLQVRVLRLPVNAGPSAARNAGIKAAQGQYVAFLDSDDLWLPSKLEEQLTLIEAMPDPQMVLCGTKIQMQLARGKDRGIPNQSNASYLFMGGGSAQTSSLMLSRGTALGIMFDESLRQFEDYLFFIMSEMAGVKFVVVDRALTVWFNDWRHDRLSMHYNKTSAAAEAFVRAAGSQLTERERVAFLINRTGDSYIAANPLRAMKDIVFGVSTGVFGVSRLFRLLARWILLPIIRRA